MIGRSMDESEHVSDLIGGIYDAALDRALWPSVLEETCRFLNGQAAALVGKTASDFEFFFEWGTDPTFLESYRSTYGMINPLHVPVMIYGKVGEVRTTSELVPYDEFVASRFFKEWATPQGIIDAITVLFVKSATHYSGLSVHRHARDGFFDDESRRRFSLIAPHFRRAVAIGEVINFHKLEAAALADSIDGLAAAMFLVDSGARLVHVNAAGHAMLDQGDAIRAVAGKFIAVDAQADTMLRDIFVTAEHGDRAVSTRGIDVPLSARGGECHVAHVLPLTSGARRQAGVAYSAVAAVFVHKTELDVPHPLETIARVFRLTSAEMRVLMMIVQLGGVRQVAPVLGISEPTVKTHLQHVFEKTSTSRQADLVKLVAGYMSPLAQARQ